jgi:propanol-preferring alcohol dehydrogenase
MATEIAVPKQHKAVVYDKPGTVSTKVAWVDTPEPGAGEVLIRLYATTLGS